VYVALFGIPIVLGAWALWVPLTAGRPQSFRVGGLIACLAVIWSAFLLIRVNGTHGNMRADVHWRWTPTAEQLYLAQGMPKSGPTTQLADRQLRLRPGDWPGFRGPNRDGIVRGLSIALDWAQSPPTVLWRQRIGPGWSSMAVVDGCVFTQEQRGPREAVACRDAGTGREIWAHEEAGRFDEAMSGPGPRATPTFSGGRIYAQGALGALSCLDAATGQLIWTRDVRSDAAAAVPIWGFCNSPLVTGDRVIVFAGGEGKKSLLAYPLDGGAPLWTADAGKVSYSSPQAFDFGSKQLVVVFATEGLFGVDVRSGQLRWQFPLGQSVGVPVVVQPCRVSGDSFALGYGSSFGTERVELSADAQSVKRGWVTRQMKPSFSDMVYHDGFLYGFDGTVFCCTDASTGARRWREGRYGAGQVLLLADQGVMIVTAEDGSAILLRCNPQHNEELGRIPLITGKAWNHPAIADGRLYLRSDAEMACVELKSLGK
jgi:outer membrane protein assembly factor BamB